MRGLLIVAALGCTALVAEEAEAQLFLRGRFGSLGYSNGMGTYTYVYPSRMNFGANLAIPGTRRVTPWGNSWTGFDGRYHGNFVNPYTGNLHQFRPPHPTSRPPGLLNNTRPSCNSPFGPRPCIRPNGCGR